MMMCVSPWHCIGQARQGACSLVLCVCRVGRIDARPRPKINTLSELVFSGFFCLTKLCLNEYPPAVLVPMPACLFPLPQPKQVSRPIPVYRFALDPSRPRFDEQGTFGQNPGNFSVALTFLLLQAPLTRSHEAAGQLNGDSTSYS